MRSLASPDRPPSTRRALRGVAVLAAGLALGTIAVGCGSDSGSDATTARGDAALCDAIEQYRAAERAGDRTGMAAALRPIVEGLPEEQARAADAYVVTLSGSPAEANATNAAGKRQFLAYVEQRCGDTGGGGGSTTSTTPATTTMPEDLSPTTTVATGGSGSGTNDGTGSSSNGSSNGSGNGSTESDGSTGTSGNSDPATNGPGETTGG